LGASEIMVADEGDQRRRALAGRAEQTAQNGMTAEEWASLVDGLHEAARVCGDLGLTLCVHPHAGSYIEHQDEIARLMDETRPELVKLCFDTGHVAFGGGDPLAVARTRSEERRVGYGSRMLGLSVIKESHVFEY